MSESGPGDSKTRRLRRRALPPVRLNSCWMKWLFPIAGLVALIWFLVRVVPKPSRAAYPCQRAVAPMASAFAIWFLGVVASVWAARKGRHYFGRSRYVIAAVCIAVSVGALWLSLSITREKTVLADAPVPNAPIGVARGVHPGRVVWVHDPDATSWEGPGQGHWWEKSHTNQAVVDRMMSRAIRQLAGEVTVIMHCAATISFIEPIREAFDGAETS